MTVRPLSMLHGVKEYRLVGALWPEEPHEHLECHYASGVGCHNERASAMDLAKPGALVCNR